MGLGLDPSMGHPGPSWAAQPGPSQEPADTCSLKPEEYSDVPLLSQGKPSAEPAGHQNGLGVYQNGMRDIRDIKWRNAYIATMIAFVAGFIVSCCISDNKTFFNANKYSLAVCSEPAGQGRRLLELDGDEGLYEYNHPAWPLVLSGVLALGTGWLFLLGFKHKPAVMVRIALILVVAIPILQGVILAAFGIVGGAIVGFIVAIILAATIYYLRHQIELVSRLLGVASRAIVETPSIIGFGVGMQCFYVFLLVPIFALFAVEALAVGQLARNPEALRQTTTPTLLSNNDTQTAPTCEDADGMVVRCCQFQTGGWGIFYMIFWSLVVLWNGMLLGQVQRFTVAGAVAQWYFTPAWLGPAAGADKPGQGRVMKSLRHAMGPSFGSLCASAVVLGIINMLQELLKFCQRQIRRPLIGLAFMLVAFLLRSLLSLVEFLTHMTTARMALTGEAFFDAAHSTYAIMKRNGLESLGVWWLPRYILGASALAISSLYAVLVFLVMDLSWQGDALASFFVALLGWWVCCLVLSFMCSLLINAVDGAFMCFLMDRDAARVTRQDVHQALQCMPGLQGQVIELPDGDIMYGAPAQQPQQPHQVSPPLVATQPQLLHNWAAGPSKA